MDNSTTPQDDAAMSPASAGSAEPLAWAVMHKNSDRCITLSTLRQACQQAVRQKVSVGEYASARDLAVVPLYTTPQPTLTDEEREAVREAAGEDEVSEPLAWAVLLADGRLYGRYDFQWEARAIADALLANDGVPAIVEPLYRSPTLTDAEREAIDTAEASLLRESTDIATPQPVRQRLGAAAATLRGLLERTK